MMQPVLVIRDAQTAGDADVDVLASVLPAYRIRKALRYRKRADRVNCITAFAMLAYLLKTQFDRDLPQLEIRNAYGRPLLDPPLWMSISHSGGAVCCCAAAARVGVDAEETVTRSAALAGTVLSAAEYAVWQAADDPARCFTEFWTQKEAYLKYLGTGLTDNLTHVDARGDVCTVRTVWMGQTCISLCALQPPAIREMRIRELTAWVRCGSGSQGR